MGLTDAITRTFCQTTGGSPTSLCSAVCHTELRLDELRFSANHPVEKDTHGNFPQPEYKQGRADQFPVCYTRNTRISVTATFEVVTPPCASEVVEIRGRENFGTQSLEWTSTVTVAPSASSVTTSVMISSAEIPDEVACYDPADIAWHYNPGGAGWRGAGNSNNVCYATLAAPSGAPAYWTLLDISCRAAAGETDEAGLAHKSFDRMKTSVGAGNGLVRKRDGTRLTYYLNAINTPSSGVFTTHDLLNRADGTGRCGAWARFLVSMYQCHGITSASVFGVEPREKAVASLLLVKNCNFSGAGTLGAPLMHRGNTECVKQAGLPGQGNDNPQFIFGDHALVRFNGEVFDPSYGSGPYTDMKLWENDGIAGVGELPAILFTGTGGEPQVITTRCSPGFIEYTVAANDSLSIIAGNHGIGAWRALYDHRYNAAFKTLRPDPNVIEPGDKLWIPREIARIRILEDV